MCSDLLLRAVRSVFGFRGFVGWDWVNYYPAYQEIVPLFSRGYLNNYDIGTFEGGFVTFMSVVKLISSNYHFFILICVVIDVSILHVFFKRHSSNYAFSFLIFIALYLGAELDILRNMKSIGLFLLSVKYIQQRRFLPYLLLMTRLSCSIPAPCSCSRCILCPGHCPGSVSSSYLSSAISFTFRRSLTWPL